MLSVCLIRGAEGFANARHSLIVKLADLRMQVVDDGLELRAGLEKFQALGDQRGHGFCASFLDLAGSPVVQLLTK